MLKKRWFGLLLLLMSTGIGRAVAQTASFNFTAFPHSVSGWTNVVGDPSTAVRSVTAGTITISSVATANWAQFGGQSAFDSVGENVNGFFPAAVLFNHWYNYELGFNAANPQLKLSGLSVNGVYTIKLAGSTTSSLNANPTMYTVIGLINYGSLGVNNHNNSTDGAIFNGVVPDATGSISIYINALPTTQVADISGLTISANGSTGVLTLGAGIGQVGSTMDLGDSVAGKGPHSFVTNRYQFLGGHQYSIGGSVTDPVNKPVMRLYDNGVAAFGADIGFNTVGQPAMRYYPRMSLLQLGATDHLDTSAARSGGSGILINSDVANAIKGTIHSSIVSGDSLTIDSLISLSWSMLMGENIHLSASTDHSLVIGFGHRLAGMSSGIVSGQSNRLNKGGNSADEIAGFLNTGSDTAVGSLIGGATNQFGGPWQFVAGSNLTNRTPAGATMGSGNVDFSTFSYTGLQGLNAPNLNAYPLFALGNAGGSTTTRSNAATVLYNGRTQINTTGFTNSLTQSAATPQAALDVVSTNTGVLLPRLTTTQQNAIAGTDLHGGLLFYNTDSSGFRYYNGSSWSTVGHSASSRWAFAGGSVYDTTDNIAIGTTNPKGYKLAVNGTAIFVRMVVKSAGTWPDYVFRRNYRLPGLDDLERYLTIHHHLPGMAGNAEVMQRGINVAEQQAALLRKAEEVALYLLQENAELKAQTRELNEKAALLDAHQKEIDGLKELLKSIK